MTTLHSFQKKIDATWRKIRELFNLRADTDEEGTLQSIRANVDFRSANAWTLVFAILIASIGLNINSAAVVIGAMLISPLMGPILGAGLGLGINDVPLVKRAVTNLGYAVAISIAVSFLYFLISPIEDAQTELLARTRPTFFDALIAIFGGAAGIVALSRRERSNAIPGVAIATALMPPLCTAGYGLAHGKFSYFLGAMYLFLLNSVFICMSTMAFIRLLKFQRVVIQRPAERKRLRQWVAAVSVLVLLPSFVSAWLLLRESGFRSRADAFVKKELQFDGTFLVGTEIHYHWRHPKIVVRMLGEPLTEAQTGALKLRLAESGLPTDSLDIRQSSIAEQIERKLQAGFEQKDLKAKEADIRAATLEMQVEGYRRLESMSVDLGRELNILFPKLARVHMVNGDASAPAAKLVLVQWDRPPAKAEMLKLDDFLRLRLKEPEIEISHLGRIPSPRSLRIPSS